MSIGKVIDRIGRTHGELGLSPGAIAAWCFEAIEANGVYESLEKFAKNFPVDRGTVNLPCNVYRVETVGSCNCCNNIRYTIDKGRILLHNRQPASIWVSGTVIPSDEKGYPIVHDLMADACYWYVITKALESGYFSGTIPGDRYERAEANYHRSVSAAKGSLRSYTQDDLRTITTMLRSFALPKR